MSEPTYTDAEIKAAVDAAMADEDAEVDQCRCCCCTGECRQPYEDDGEPEEVVDLDRLENEAAEAMEAAFLASMEEQEYFDADV